MKKILLLTTILFSFILTAQKLKSPSEFLGYELGTKFSRHHEVVDYYQYIAATLTDQVQLQEYGKTNEGRPLLLSYVSSVTNMQNLDDIRLEHLKSTTGEGNNDIAIVWLSYNVHGNESVGTEASMQTIYELLTSKSGYLENTVVIIDPCVNPDGRDRYVNWYNQFKNTPYTADPNSKEHHESWLNGRANHYMFDLNRDWAWLTQIESQQRLKYFNKWLPHIHVDFHEQAVDNPYFFAPAAEPFHEVITDFQRDFQATVGKNHAKYFDAKGWFYYTKEIYDLFYPSYGDTYPTYNGGIGMTYEQGGSGRAGLAIKTKIGDTLTLKDRIAHHRTTGLSTIEVATKNAATLNTEFRKFYTNKNYKYNSYVLNGNPDNMLALTKLLSQHEIEYTIGNTSSLKGFNYINNKKVPFKNRGNSLVISTKQPKSTLVKVLFEPQAKLVDSLTYDITAWSLPYAYGLNAIASENHISTVGTKNNPGLLQDDIITTTIHEDTYGYVTDWNSMNDARFLADLLNANIRVRYSKKPFSIKTKQFKRGSLIITKADNASNKRFLIDLKSAVIKHQQNLKATESGFVEAGRDFGSEHVKMINDVKVAVLAGKPVSTLRFGEVWHFFEQQLHYPLAVIDSDYMDNVNFSDYDVLILPSGNSYTNFIKGNRLNDIKKWVSNGGKLIAMGTSIKAFVDKSGFTIKTKETKKGASLDIEPYDISERSRIKNSITGAIFETKVDITHPLAYGYNNTYFTLKLGAEAYQYLDSGNVVYLENNKNIPISGFAGSEAQKKINKTVVFGVEKHGKGSIVYMVDNPLFRGFWENGKLFFANAIFMVD